MHVAQIKENLKRNNLDVGRTDIQTSDLFKAFANQQFDIIVTNPPYIPEHRKLDVSVMDYEPHEALFAGKEGLDVIHKIIKETPQHLSAGGELWMEGDVENIAEAESLYPCLRRG